MADLKNMTLADEVSHFVEQCKAIVGQPVTAETAPKLRALQNEATRINKALDAAKAVEKRPHLDANTAIEERYKPLSGSVTANARAVTAALTAFLEAEDARIREARRAAEKLAKEEAERAAKLAAEAEVKADPFERFDAKQEAKQVQVAANAAAAEAREPVKVNIVGAEGGRAAALKTVGWDVEITDAAALVLHYATRSDVIEAAKKLAAAEARASKGEAQVPGVVFKAIRKAA